MKADAERLRAFHSALTRAYAEEMPFKALHGHMCEVMSYMAACFEGTKRALKLMRKARSTEEYLESADILFDSCSLKETPYFDPLGPRS